MVSSRPETPRAVTPWATVTLAIVAMLMPVFPRWGSALVYDRAAILHGEGWRLWTGSFVPFSAGQLWWNLVVLLPAGIWVERLAPVRTRWLLALAPFFIGAQLLVLEPTLPRFGGLSGVTAAALTLLVFEQTARRSASGLWWGVLGLLVLKILIELFSGRALFAALADPAMRPVPLAQVAGVVCARAAYLWRRRN